MPLVVTSTSQALRHGIFGIEVAPPSVIQATGPTVVALVELFPWGPDTQIVQIEDIGDFLQKYAPGGMTRTGAGVMSVIGKAWPILKIVRVIGASPAIATSTVNKSGPAACVVLHAKYNGAAGNSLTATVTDATDGDANHFNLAVSVTSASGTTTDFFQNLNYSGTGTQSTPDFTDALLLGNITVTAAGIALRGTTSFTGGSDGTITSSSYVGTQGAPDKGISLLEGDATVDLVITGDPGNSIRAAVNAGLQAHADYTTTCIAIINGNSGQSAASAQTDVANYRSDNCVYVDVWANQADDVDGTIHLVPPAPFCASLAANLSPSTSFSWKSSEAKKYLTNIVSLEAARGDLAYTNELNGICTLQKEDLGGYTFECAVTTNAPIAPAKKKFKRTRMAIYMLKSIKNSLRESVDAPNVPFNQQDQVHAVSVFVDQLVANASLDPNHLPHLVEGSIDDLATYNTQSSLDAGNFFIPVSAKTSSDEEKIFIALNIGETVNTNSST